VSAITFATLCDRLMAITVVFAASAPVTFPATASAGVRPQVDLSLQVTTAPVPFVPGGHGTVYADGTERRTGHGRSDLTQ